MKKNLKSDNSGGAGGDDGKSKLLQGRKDRKSSSKHQTVDMGVNDLEK
jgi:hypothetical protein